MTVIEGYQTKAGEGRVEAVLPLQLVGVLDFVAPILFPGDILNKCLLPVGKRNDIIPISCLCALDQPSNWVPFYNSLPSHLQPPPPLPPPLPPPPAMLFNHDLLSSSLCPTSILF